MVSNRDNLIDIVDALWSDLLMRDNKILVNEIRMKLVLDLNHKINETLNEIIYPLSKNLTRL
jgi:hypothetical protein